MVTVLALIAVAGLGLAALCFRAWRESERQAARFEAVARRHMAGAEYQHGVLRGALDEANDTIARRDRSIASLRAALDAANRANAHFVVWTGGADPDVCALAESLKDNDPEMGAPWGID